MQARTFSVAGLARAVVIGIDVAVGDRGRALGLARAIEVGEGGRGRKLSSPRCSRFDISYSVKSGVRIQLY